MKYNISVFVLSVLIIIYAAGCNDDTVNNGPTVSQETIDNEVAFGLYSAFSEIFSKIQFTPLINSDIHSINIDTTIYSPINGHAVIQGTLNFDTITQRIDIFLSMGFWNYAVSVSNNQTNLTYNGLTGFTGFVNQYTMNCTMKASMLYIKGKIGTQDIDISCAIDLALNFNKTTLKGTITGNECGRNVDFSF